MGRPPITRIVRDLPKLVPFVGPEAQERARGRPFAARLGANESLFGPSPAAIRAMRDAAAENWKYSDPENYDLRHALARHHGVAADNVVIGEGIDGLLGLAVKIAAEPGEVVVTSDGAYPTFNFHVAAQGATLVKVPYRDDREDLGALLDAVKRHDARVVYVSNPDNPMGSWWPASELLRLIDALPDGVLLLLDEAYCDTAPPDAAPPIDVANPQVLRLRTFSKAYGLAGARIGYAVGERELISLFEKVRNHYGINRVGQIGALEALIDQAYLADAVGRIARARDKISDIARAQGLVPLPSGANFVTIDCGVDGAFARAVLDKLLARDIFVRKPAVAPLDRCIRVSCGRDEDLALFAAALPAALATAREQK
ncbi:MAG: pyridoxal phosphate-dependent aminotransferase [Hyphomicrobium zavarzinii]|jgi:histidinol-phosphate aminotransferase|uniref:pyridoxal phosphate-dependent aminotransferase n=1 Tax=Hyphomicrobium zavarzinii TaxID=48292 RepID=UPI001A60810D|nr:pyridoxal phosphate-dependent aminotransferase [Hyphomicrobium zavarzinii]MBL8845377.1 pyridoxal phosphate-dependent aminotransferase [Hyphomicrobium zavarzinii]